MLARPNFFEIWTGLPRTDAKQMLRDDSSLMIHYYNNSTKKREIS